jgi:hypothetical protein
MNTSSYTIKMAWDISKATEIWPQLDKRLIGNLINRVGFFC